ncbi:MAG: FtsB family cell division protein [bacterium]
MGLTTAPARDDGTPPHRRLPRRAVTLIVLIVGALGVQVFGSSFLDVYRLDRESARLEALKRDLQEQNAILREEIKLLYTAPYIEKLAREQLGLVKPGEVAILVVQPGPQPLSAPARREQDNPSQLRRLWLALLKRLQ